MSVVRITVTKLGDEYFATRTLEHNLPGYNPPGAIFSQKKDIPPEEQATFEEEVRQECRRRGIPRVINLDK